MVPLATQGVKARAPEGEELGGRRVAPPPDHTSSALRAYLAVGGLALLLGIVHGWLQTLPAVQAWIAAAGYPGYLISPLAHARLNILGALLIALVGLTFHVTPWVFGRSVPRRLSVGVLALLTGGVFGHYLVLLGLGLGEGGAVTAGAQQGDVLAAWQPLHSAAVAITTTSWAGGLVFFAATLARIWRSSQPTEALSEGWLRRFFVAAAAAAAVGGIHGAVQALPLADRWIREAQYAGHMVAHLSLTHLLVVGSATLMLTGLAYHLLPRLGRPLYSRNLASISFWFSVVGIGAFYLSLLSLGLAEGRLVHQGLTYEEAKATMAALHKALLMESGLTLGVGYWTFAANILLSLRGPPTGGSARETSPPADRLEESWAGTCRLLLGLGVTAFLLGTVQGVLQVIPAIAEWIHQAGAAGRLIDPLAHAHANMVGGSLALLIAASIGALGPARPEGILRALRQLASYGLLAGVAAFYLSALGLGLVEGYFTVHTANEVPAKELMGRVHPALLASTGAAMAAGILGYLAALALLLNRSRTTQQLRAPELMVPLTAPGGHDRPRHPVGVWLLVLAAGGVFVGLPVVIALITLSSA